MTTDFRTVLGSRFAGAILYLLLTVLGVSAQQLQEEPLPLDGWMDADGGAVHLTWTDAPRAHRGPVEVARRPYGATGAASWEQIPVVDQPGLRLSDTTTEVGQAYEYRVLRRTGDGQIKDAGYWLAGRDLPELSDRGVAYVVVDETVLPHIQAHLARFLRDLKGDGWRVRTLRAPRHDPKSSKANLAAVAAIKDPLRAMYHDAPSAARHAIILVGHVPLVLSGSANPDGHAKEPHATDLIYGDVDGRWRVTQEGVLLDNSLPSDVMEMQVGRIDFAPVAAGQPEREAQLLRAYFDKNHNWRHLRLGDLRAAYGRGDWLTSERYGLRNIVGPQAITEGGHHDVGEAQPWLWGVDFGDFNGRRYASDYANKAVFAINFGSLKQKIDRPFNPMTALLAQPWYPLAVGWGARPAWWLHHMALGGSIGDVHMRTVNNGLAAQPYATSLEYLPTGRYLWRNPIWVNLLGDPTLHAFPLAPPGPVSAVRRTSGVVLSWTPASGSEVMGYRVYKENSDGTFSQISGPEPVSGTTFTDPAGGQGSVYMVRALGRKDVYAGSFLTLSQGVFGTIDYVPVAAPPMRVSVVPGTDTPVPFAPDAARQNMIFGFVTGPKQGQLHFDEGVWRYRAPSDFSGDIALRYVVSDILTSDDGALTLTVQP